MSEHLPAFAAEFDCIDCGRRIVAYYEPPGPKRCMICRFIDMQPEEERPELHALLDWPDA
jgi:hypothetical protein